MNPEIPALIPISSILAILAVADTIRVSWSIVGTLFEMGVIHDLPRYQDKCRKTEVGKARTQLTYDAAQFK